MEDLSHLFANGPVSALAPTSQSGGGVPHDNRAMTAPGGSPANAADDTPDSAPSIDTTVHQRSAVTRADKPVIRLGQWNNI